MRTDQWLLLAVVWITDFAAMMVIFAVSRNLAESGSDPTVLGLAGGGFSLVHGDVLLVRRKNIGQGRSRPSYSDRSRQHGDLHGRMPDAGR